MTHIKTKLTTAAISGALFLGAITPAFAADANVFGNGAFSTTDISVMSDQMLSVEQNNDANISNDVSLNSDTGGNSSGFNTGGGSMTRTGDANSFVSIENMANQNIADLGSMSGGSNQDAAINVGGNGAFSDTSVDVEMNHDISVSQDNNADFDNTISSDSTTGKNDSNYNTSWNRNSSGTLMSGDTNSYVSLHNAANTNSFGIGGMYGPMHSNMNWSKISNMMGWMNYMYSM